MHLLINVYLFKFCSYIRRETAQFFGVDEESEASEKQRWLDRRRRMASRKYGTLVPEHRPPDPDITRDVPDTTETPEVSALYHENIRSSAIIIV